MKGVLGLLVVLIAGYFAWKYFGGELSGSAPDVARPDIGVPDANEAGNKAKDVADSAADEVATWSLQTWKLIVIGIVATALTLLWFRSAKFKWTAIGIFVAVVFFIGFLPQFQ